MMSDGASDRIIRDGTTMAGKTTRTMARSMVRRSASVTSSDGTDVSRPTVIGIARPVSAQEMIQEPSETDLLLHQSHDLVAQLREAVGRPRLDLL